MKLLEPYEINEVKFSKIHPSAYKLLTLVNTVATFLTVVLNNLRFFGASVPTPVPAPKTDNLYLYFVELNPSLRGQPIKKRGVYLKNSNEYEAFQELFNNQKVKELLDVVSECYGKQRSPRIEI